MLLNRKEQFKKNKYSIFLRDEKYCWSRRNNLNNAFGKSDARKKAGISSNNYTATAGEGGENNFLFLPPVCVV